jgi:hypothetical protein
MQALTTNGINHQENDTTIRIDTRRAVFELQKNNAFPISSVSIGKQILDLKHASLALLGADADNWHTTVTHTHYSAASPLRHTFNSEVTLINSTDRRKLLILSKLTFHHNSSLVQCQLTLRNPNPCRHPGGFWDLGDPGSVYIHALQAKLPLAGEASIQIEPNGQWYSGSMLSLKQHASGGENWNSPNHVNKDGAVTLQQQGYECHIGTKSLTGRRANPVLSITANEGGAVYVKLDKFWQNYPSSLSYKNGELSITLFGDNNTATELQGGEQKTRHLTVDFDASTNSPLTAVSPSTVRIDPEYLISTHTINGLGCDKELQQIINQGIDGPNNFFNKRERIDEYGWRNFGDLHADHEALEHNNSPNIISHYNNQYDPILGFYRQYLLSGDDRWLELAQDLAQHVIDIDIYHTQGDKAEYNNGLFWHTDHYLDAETATHRTFSKKHLEHGHTAQSGGGPGTEHCYTTGLAYHYLLTGNEQAKQAVLELAQWMYHAQHGSDALLEGLYRHARKTSKLLLNALRGNLTNAYLYPMTRGTGNYINSQLDVYEVTGEAVYLDEAHRIIRHTLHPSDDISQRGFDDIEATWSYTVLLQAVSRFIKIKLSIEELDEQFVFARECLLHYANWMAEHESPYLNNREKLVYPNHTWTAQDLRKASIFYDAYHLSNKQQTGTLQLAQSFFHGAINTLSNDDNGSSCRILVLLMQNQLQISQTPSWHHTTQNTTTNLSTCSPRNSFTKPLLRHLFKDLWQRLQNLSPTQELAWLKSRFKFEP